MKKMYKNPEIEIAEIAPQTIICSSAGLGGTTGSIDPGNPDPIPGD